MSERSSLHRHTDTQTHRHTDIMTAVHCLPRLRMRTTKQNTAVPGRPRIKDGKQSNVQ